MPAPLINEKMEDCLAEGIGRKLAYQLKKKKTPLNPNFKPHGGRWQVKMHKKGNHD